MSKYVEVKKEGQVSWKSYVEFFKNSKSPIRAVIIVVLSMLIQILLLLVDILIGYR